MQRRRNHPVFGRNTRVLSEAVKSSPSPCKLDHGGLEPNAIAIYEEVMYRMLPLIHSSHVLVSYESYVYAYVLYVLSHSTLKTGHLSSTNRTPFW